MANVFLPAGETADAKGVALDAAARIEPLMSHSPSSLAIWGSLMLTAAAAAAQSGDAPEAWHLLGEASAAARMLTRDHADLHAIFGPTIVSIYAVNLAAELDDSYEAVRRGEGIRLDRLPPQLRERRSHLLVNLARGHEQLGNDQEALAHLLQAETFSPEDVRRGAAPRIIVSRLLDRERRAATPGLRALAARIGIAA